MLNPEISRLFLVNAYYCGLDVHKESTYATVINVFGEVQTQGRVKNEEVLDFLESYPSLRVAYSLKLACAQWL